MSTATQEQTGGMAVPSAVLESGDLAVSSDDSNMFIAFTVGSESYGIDIMSVREIKGWADVTSLPKQPEYMRGVLNLRGVIVPIFDLRCRFVGVMTEATERHVVIIAAVGERIVGILVDAVSDILNVDASELRSVPDVDGRADSDFLTSLVTVGERMVAILSLDRLLKRSLKELGDVERSPGRA